MKYKNLKSKLLLLSGLLFLVVGFISKDNVFVPIGCSFVVLSVTSRNKNKDESN